MLCERGAVALVARAGPGVGPGERRTVVLGVWPSGEAGIGVAGAGAGAGADGAGVGGGGVGVGKSGARKGAVSSKVR